MLQTADNTAVAQPVSSAEEPDGSRLRYYARQPILNLKGDAYAYELLFRSGPESTCSSNADKATWTILDTSVADGLEKLTGGLPAFVNCTLQTLTSRVVEVLPPSLTVLEILETVEPTPELIAACQRLKSLGFRIALDDFIWHPKYESLVQLADYIKVDFTLSAAPERVKLIKKLRKTNIRFLAEKVETPEQFKQARKEGFTLFQGYYFCRPTLIKRNEIPANKLARLELARDLQQEDFDVRRISRLVERDAAIAFRLLRLANSPLYAVRQEISSIETAVMLMGEKAFRRVVMLAIATALNEGRSTEILRLALTRARFCELAASLVQFDPSEQYLLGLFSLLPAMLQVSMEQAISSLALRDEIRSSLLGAKIPERSLLCWIEASESSQWTMCDAVKRFHQLAEPELARIAADSVAWADENLKLTE